MPAGRWPLVLVVGAVLACRPVGAAERHGPANFPSRSAHLVPAPPGPFGVRAGVKSSHPPRPGGRTAEGADASDLLSALGCGACHTGVPEPVVARRASPPLGPKGRAVAPDSLLALLLSPSPGRRAGSQSPMPTFHLSGAEAVALVRFMVSELPASPGGASTRFDALRRRYPESDSARGRAIFLALDCAGCHSGTNVPAWKSAPDLSREATRARPGWLASWLAHPIAIRPFGFFPGTGTRMPDFGLSPSELRALVDALTTGERGTAGSVAVVAPRGAPLSPYRELEAARLMADRSACLGCHAYGGRGGRIGPDLARVRLRRPPAYIWAVLRDPHAAAPRTIMPRSPGSPERDTLFYRLLTSGRSPGPAGRASSEDTAAVIRGARAPDAPDAPDAPGDTLHDGYLDLTDRALRPPDRWMLEDAAAPTTAGERYAQLCSSCHGPAGAGDGFNAPFLPVPPARHADSAGMAARTDARLFNAIYGGGRVLGRSPRMPAFGRSLAREAIWGLVGHIRSLCGCRGPAWYRDNDETGGASHASGRAEPDTALQTRRRR